MSCLIPGESLKVSSKAFELISNQIKGRLLNKDQASNEVQFIPQQKSKDGRNGDETKVDSLQEEKVNGEKSDSNVLSKFQITDRYDAENFLKIKDAIKVRLVSYEIQKELHRGHYSTELKRWQKKLRSYRDYERSIAKVTTHPKGKEELENRKLINLKQRIVPNIPEPGEKETRYLRSEIRELEHIDTYSLDIWKFKEVQTFINLFFDHYKNFPEIQNKLPDKKIHEIIALYDLMNPILCLKKFYKKAKQKPSALRKEFLKSVLPKIKEKLLFILKDLILISCANQTVIPLGEVKFSRKDLISCFTAEHI